MINFQGDMDMKRSILAAILLLLLLMTAALGEETLTVTASSDIVGFSDNTITVEAAQAGTLTLRLADSYGVYRTLTQEIEQGTTQIIWNGLAENEEKLPTGDYTFYASLQTKTGEITSETKVTAARPKQALLFALRSSDTLYLDDKDWFCEVRLVRDGRVIMDIYAADEPDKKLDTIKKSISGVTKISWNGYVNKKALPAGEYVLKLYAQDNPDYVREVRVTIAEGTRPEVPVAVTGSIMPSWDMDDEALWELMMQPSVVLDITSTNHQKVYEKASSSSTSLGTLHGQSQCLEVLKIEGDWAKIGAWQHESGGYIEGWVPLKKLKTVTPNSDYALLVDKETQQMRVLYQGKTIAQFGISSGLAGKNRLIRETAAGSFVTLEHMDAFEDSGYHYEYPIRYDGGNLIHQLGYKAKRTKKDFSAQEPVLGQKASHGCIRIQRAADESGINAYYFWTHLPYNTRLIILDDEENRTLQAAAVSSTVIVQAQEPEEAPELAEDETELVLTLGGDAVLGTREYWWDSEESLPSYLEKYGMSYPFSGLYDIFSSDDMTFINLECVLKETAEGENKSKEWRFRGLPSYTEALWAGSIEQVNIANNHYIDYGTKGQDETRQSLIDAGMPFSGAGYTYVWEQDGHKIGFAGCRETTYKDDETVIARDILSLREQGCDVIIYSCHWGTEYAAAHNDLQEEMAYRAVAAGADIVVGNHPHVVQGMTCVNGSVIFYSFGNLMFGGTHDMTTFDAMIAQVRLRFRGDSYVGCTVEIIPILTSSQADEKINNFCPVVAEGDDYTRIWEKIQKDTPFTLMESMYFEQK